MQDGLSGGLGMTLKGFTSQFFGPRLPTWRIGRVAFYGFGGFQQMHSTFSALFFSPSLTVAV